MIAAAAATLALAATASSAPSPSRPALSRVATALAGTSARVGCANLWNEGWWGYAVYGTGEIKLDLRICQTLAERPRVLSRPWPTASSGQAVFTLAHEAAHVRGHLDEERADCFALRNTGRAALLLGFRRSDLPRLEAQASVLWTALDRGACRH